MRSKSRWVIAWPSMRAMTGDVGGGACCGARSAVVSDLGGAGGAPNGSDDWAYYGHSTSPETGLWEAGSRAFVSDFNDDRRSDVLFFNANRGTWNQLINDSAQPGRGYGTFIVGGGFWDPRSAIVTTRTDTTQATNQAPLAF